MRRSTRVAAWIAFALLARADAVASPLAPGIIGTYYQDTNLDGQVSVGESIAGLSLQLYRDNGDGVFDPTMGDVPFGSPVITGALGEYSFSNLPDAGFFIFQATNGSYIEQVSDLVRPTDVDVLIDDFVTQSSVNGSNLNPTESSMADHHPDDSPLSGMREVHVGLISGVGDAQVLINPFGLDSKLIYSTSAGVTGEARVTWDYASISGLGNQVANVSPIDLTEGGTRSGLMLRLGVDQAGANDVITVRLLGLDDVDFSEAEIAAPVTDGFDTEFVFVPFSEFSGSVDPTEAFGVEIELGAGEASVDASIDVFGVLGPKVQNVSVTVPEPTSVFLCALATLVSMTFLRHQKRAH